MDKIKPPPTVTFRYDLTTKAELESGPVCYSNFGVPLTDIHQFFIKETPVLKSDQILLSRLLYKFNNQLRHFKTLKYLKQINQFMKKFPNLLQSVTEHVTLLKECTSQQAGGIFLPSRQMVEYLLVKMIELVYVLRKIVIFCTLSFRSCLIVIYRAELTSAHLLFSSLVSRIWLISRALILYIVDWYNEVHRWISHLKGTQADILQGLKLPNDLKQWLDEEHPVDDDPSVIDMKLTEEAEGVLSRFAEVDSQKTLTSDEKLPEETAVHSEQKRSKVVETDIGVAISRGSAAVGNKRKSDKMKLECGEIVGKEARVDRLRSVTRKAARLSSEQRTSDVIVSAEPLKKKKMKSKAETLVIKKKSRTKSPQEVKDADKKKKRDSSQVKAPASMKNSERISKSMFITEMKVKLKKPSRFMKDLKNNSVELGGKKLVLSGRKLDKIVSELTPKLEEFKSIKSDASRLSGGRRAKKMKEMKKLRVDFKNTAKKLMWKVAEKHS